MDNFMDKLAKRFNAGEIMRANAEAEAREMKRAREQAAEYERMMQEMRRLNLKNVEVTEQVQQLIQSGIEQFEEYDRNASLLSELGENNRQLGEAGKILAQEVAIVRDGVTQTGKELGESIGQVQRELGERIGQVQQELGGSNAQMQKEVTESLVQSGQKLENSIAQTGKELGDAVALSQNAVKAELEQCQRTLLEDVAQSRTEVLEHTSEAKEELLQGLGQVKDKLDNMQAVLSRLEDKASPEDDEEKQLFEQLKASVDAMQPHVMQLQDYVHRENVKVYRNVQAVILDVAGQKTRELSDRLDTIEKKSNGSKKVMPVAILAMLFSLAGLIMQFLIYAGVL